jgi:hypothetical protein
MEIGYLAPPVATNLFVASALFKKPFGQVCRAIMPGLGITCAALLVFIYVPTLSKGLVNLTRGQPVWESFPWDGVASEQARQSGPSYDLDALSKEASDEATREATGVGGLNTQSDDEYYFNSDPDEQDAGADDDNDDTDGGLDLSDVPL